MTHAEYVQKHFTAKDLPYFQSALAAHRRSCGPSCPNGDSFAETIVILSNAIAKATVYEEATGTRVATAFESEANARLIAAAPHQQGRVEIMTTLPPGFDSEAHVLVLDAGLAYANAHWEADYDMEPSAVFNFATPHPECYVEVFMDGSAYVHDNGGDEVWSEFDDYLSHYDLEVTSDEDGEPILTSSKGD